MGRLAVTALPMASEITEGGELRFAFASDRRDFATAVACFVYAPDPTVLSRWSAAMPPHSVAMPPGSMTTTLMPNGATSIRRQSLSTSRANFVP